METSSKKFNWIKAEIEEVRRELAEQPEWMKALRKMDERQLVLSKHAEKKKMEALELANR